MLRKIIDTGIQPSFSTTDARYLRVTNIGSILGIGYMLVWVIIAFLLTDAPIIYGSNGLLALMFALVLIFNHKGHRILASTWLFITTYLSIILFLYLLGYTSGVSVGCFIAIIIPYMSFPQEARKLAHGCSVLGCLTLISIVTFQSNLSASYDVLDPQLLQFVNYSITGFICLILVSSLSALIDRSEKSLRAERKKSDDLLHNILPVKIAKDLKETGRTVPQRHDNVTVLFTDFKGFTELVATIPAITLVNELNEIFGRFDEIVEEVGVEKIETIGDAYVAASGLENSTINHAQKCIQVAKQMLDFLDHRNKSHDIQWRMRVGIHTGPIVAGVVGKKKFNYDLFGDTMNTASRMESNSEPGKINISESTYQLVKNEFQFEPRGQIQVKGKGDLEMYFVK